LIADVYAYRVGKRGVWWLVGWLMAKWSVYWEVFPTPTKLFDALKRAPRNGVFK
jgi:hypothetical protein